MFEAGKKYKSKASGIVFECLWAGKEVAIMTTEGHPHPEIPWSKYDFPYFEEYKEPVKHIRYFNVYREHVEGPYSSRSHADDATERRLQRLGCVRVELTEGQYDE